MSIAVRRSMIGAFAAMAAVMMAASVAWACLANMSSASPWFCRHNVQRCVYNFRIGTVGAPASAARVYYSMLGGAPLASDVVSANTSYTLRWVTGDHSSSIASHGNCGNTTMSAAFKKTNGTDATFTTGTTGSWGGHGPVSMPAAGIYTICAVPSTNPSAGWSYVHYPFHVT